MDDLTEMLMGTLEGCVLEIIGSEDFMEDLFAAGPAVRTAEGAMGLEKVDVIGERYGMRYTQGTMTLD